MGWLIRHQQREPTVQAVPRDVEALERVIEALAGGAKSLHDAQVKITSTLVDAFGMAYGALWSRDPRGSYSLAYETGDLGAVLKRRCRAPRRCPRMRACWVRLLRPVERS